VVDIATSLSIRTGDLIRDALGDAMTGRKMNRREVLLVLAAVGLAGAGFRYWPEDGFRNPCPDEPLPQALLDHPLLLSAWDGIDPTRLWDCHVHLIGSGDGGSGAWMNPQMQSLAHPVQWLQRAFYLNGSCTPDDGRSDQHFIERLVWLHDQLPAGVKLMLLAFDYNHDEDGERRLEASAFYTPDAYAASIVKRYPGRFEWIASVHPYRRDAIVALREAVRSGARAVKWLPPAQGMDPASKLCDPFYQAAAELDIPLLVHAGAELAVHGGNTEDYGNPLRLRRPLEHGVRVIVAHCASLGHGLDLDVGPDGPKVSSFDLFARMMREHRYEGLLFGGLSAITQINRAGPALETVIKHDEWQPRLLHGSDYPLPGILPLFSLKQMVRNGYITEPEAEVLSAVRHHNPLLFDFVLKRTLRVDQKAFSTAPFQTREFFLSGKRPV
jgi:predicted TIM-barrel fold metal-dependent hydrolase